MSLQSYGLLKCKAIATQEERDNNRPHFHIHVRANGEDYRVSVNIKSDGPKSEVLFYTDKRFRHSITGQISKLPYGFSYARRYSIDYIRSDLGFHRENMKKIPHDKAGPDNDLNEKLNFYLNRAIESDNADVYVYGTRWKSSNSCKPDRIFGFSPSMGMHDIHMNQGNIRQWQKDNGVWQDGGIFIHFTTTDQWICILLAFQSQSWDTDDCTGNGKKRKKKKY
ncbi:YukJ family protein [Vallitalea okinawensis]|uniref:YukJ family protein n=1 Tax=Vallitalea okinawensis TaxID=2078660 RepID=UPI0013008A9C|nr:YukJ family protein [Vallitalea okinawensis]